MRKHANWLAALLLTTLVQPGWADISTTYVRDVNYPDNAVVKPDQKIIKTWECRVDSTSDVVKDAYIKVVSIVWNKGKAGLVGPKRPLHVKDTARGVKPGETYTVTVPIEVPKNLPDGLYELDIKLCDIKGNVYAPHKNPLYALLRVKSK